MVRIAITLTGTDKNVPDKLKEGITRQIAKVVDTAINKTSDPELAMMIFSDELSELNRDLKLEYRRSQILK